MEKKFFDRLDWLSFWVATIVTFAVYFYTLGPSVGLEDSGELATAAAHLGVPHPPGYPFWTMCSWLFCKLFSWVTYMGHPTPAWCVSLCSAVFGAFAAGFTAMLITRSSRDFQTSDALAFGGGVAGALAFSLSPVEWSQSTIVEVYSLNAFFLMWVFLLTYRWMRKPSDRILWLTAFVFGLGLTNYQVLVFAIVPLALVILMRNPAMFRDVFIFLAPVAATYQILQIGQLVRASNMMQADAINKHVALSGVVSTPSTTAIALGAALIVGAIVVAAVLRNRGDIKRATSVLRYLGSGGAALILLSIFVFKSNVTWTAGDELAPLIDPMRYVWVAGFVAASVVAASLSALKENRFNRELGLAALFAFIAIVIAASVPAAGSAGYQGAEYNWAKSTVMFVAVMALMGVLAWFTPKGLAFAVPVAGLQIAAFILLGNGAMNGLTHPSSWWFCWPIVWNFVLLALVYLTLPHGRSVAGAAFFTQLGVSFYVYMPIVSDLRNPPMNWGYPRTWAGFKHAIMRGQYEAIGVQQFANIKEFFSFMGLQMKHYFGDVMTQFTDLLVVFAPVPFVAGHWVVAKDHKRTFWQWMIAAAVCFLMMSGLLILLANVKGDVQDGFIQKVKFISSHAMIALWIGYGLVFAGALLRRWVKPVLFAAVAVVIACVMPIVDNYTNDRIVFELGGAEQNGHTFGWQFGAYQLDGAKAIREQLVADEEPLPDPEWPEPMELSSIFFGGTDPGRFVPTYMIYSAEFRPDVYLITQNALADDTYMSVERDLYGDEIWIPSKEDSAEAFNIYVNSLSPEERVAKGVVMENGRVQVTGALSVMDINGILTRMMFDHDRLRHSFYVEESYVIPWMYEYLSPHGLIMKINADKKPYDPQIARKDADFWDWYVRRLVKDPMYRRDFAGQKSFSKLRAAIAGLYNRQGRYQEGAQAFREACLLYPASPEATFRYAQESLLPFSKFSTVLEMMDFTDLIDPNNKRTSSLRGYIKRVREVRMELARIDAKRRDGKTPLTLEDRVSLANCYAEMGHVQEAARTLSEISDQLASPHDLAWAASLFIQAGDNPSAEKVLVRSLRRAPKDVDTLVTLSKVCARQKKVAAAQQYFIQAYNLDRQGVFGRIQNGDQELYSIAMPLFRQSAPRK